ncbi:MAG: DNA-3-methyladenine glycosylase 2 family protein [Clostridia bacterium]|nr:DNA-3-methyladenine glycosylase 2 family protein [Clostridia bacterium]
MPINSLLDIEFGVTEKGTSFAKIKNLDYFDVGAVFDCGQAFRFLPIENSTHTVEFGGVAFGKYITVAQDGNVLTVYGTDAEDFEKIWVNYLGLDFDIESARNDIVSRSDNPALAEAVEYGKGIRILRQEMWETLCSFIISQNNNIPRIRGLISTISRNLGTKVECSAELSERAGDVYAFPTPEAIVNAGVDALRDMKFGFRAPYIYDAAQKVSSGELDLLAVRAAKTTAEAAEMLMKVKGVGPKVAACTLLFGFDRTDAFPVDVWVKRVIEKYFPAPFDAASLGSYAGLAQQYLFYYERYLGGN